MHTCPMSDGPKPHVGGPILGPGVPNVLIGNLPAAVVGDLATCTGPPDTIVMGSTTVLIGGKPAVRVGDTTAHGGVITLGCPTVMIDDVPPPVAGGAMGVVSQAMAAAREASSTATAQSAALQEAAQEGVATVEECPYAKH
jgi:uncharacterized Zn-binding protein involved in type VI secretion